MTVATVTAVLTMSCGGESTTPVAPSRAPGLIRVVLRAPTTLAPGGTFQLGLHAVYSDGTSRDVTPAAQFHGDPPDVVSVSQNGMVTALNVGDARLTGHFERTPATVPVIVVPDGTFRVDGRVVEDGAPDVPLGGARVEAEGGPADVTGFDGGFRLYGVAPRSQLRVSKAGYSTRDVPLAIADHHTEVVALAVAGTRQDLSGRYQLTVEAAAECRGELPEALRTRRYTATVSQVGAAVRVLLSEARFYEWYGKHHGVVHGLADPSGSGLSLELPGPTHCEVPFDSIVEVVDGGYLQIEGIARLVRSGQALTGSLSGYIQLFDYPLCLGSGGSAAVCRSNSHRITLAR